MRNDEVDVQGLSFRQDESGVREHIRLLVGALIGSGGAAGVIMPFTGKEWWGLAILCICLTFAVSLFLFGERLVDRRRRENREYEQRSRYLRMERLAWYYVSSLTTTGELLSEKLKAIVARQQEIDPREIMNILITDLRRQGQGHRRSTSEAELPVVDLFQKSINQVTSEWENSVASKPAIEGPPPQAQPI